MSSETNGQQSGTSGVDRFERNRYFHRKLMTARDMEAEQAYHANRLHTVARHALGQGVVCGLRASVESGDADEEADSDGVTVRVDPGVALDCNGRPVVVRDVVRTSHVPTGDELYVYVTHRECDRESVPTDDASACEDECEYNRILELAEVAVLDERKEDAIHKSVADVGFPGRPAGGAESVGEADGMGEEEPADEAQADDAGSPAPTDLDAVARSYYDAEGTGGCATCEGGDPAVFVGSLTLTGESWTFTRGSLVYKNDLLYAAIARHAADFANPHEAALSLAQSDEPAGAVMSVEGLEDRERDLLFVSENDRLRIEADEEGRQVVFTVTGDGGDDEGDGDGLRSVNGLEGEDGNVELVSPQGTISIEAEGNEIRLDIAGEAPERPERPEIDVLVNRSAELVDLLNRREAIVDLADNRETLVDLADHRDDLGLIFDNRSKFETLVNRSDDIEVLAENRNTLETLMNRSNDIEILAERRGDLTNLLDR